MAASAMWFPTSDQTVIVPDHVGHLLLSVAAGATLASPASAMWRTLMLSRIPRLQQHLDLQFLRCVPSQQWPLVNFDA